ncbi:MAG TPA: crosslink repair DNA glycosylase YcaQ family protein [Oculatellaceae cyanobacterium]
MSKVSLQQLRAASIAHSLFPATSMTEAIARLGFVQADPIRAPAAAQDLILRPRVKNYRAGDLEREYARLEVEEDFLYAYGFLPRNVWRLLHPRRTDKLDKLEKRVLEAVLTNGAMHPRELESRFGAERVVNAWGGYSKATTRALERLQFRGLLRIARREKGVRIYEDAAPYHSPAIEQERLKLLALLVANIFGPCPRKSLQETLNRLRHSVPRPSELRSVIDELLHAGELRGDTFDGLDYVWPATLSFDKLEVPEAVSFLAPFDPLVWDRARFEHWWGWAYRFEAYTPIAKRIRGYYAMPLLYRDSVIGWINITASKGKLSFAPGFVEKRPKEKQFKTLLEQEMQRMETFLDSQPV